MFSFVIYDKKTYELFCVRDGFGIKPFYYYQYESEFYFASEIPALLKFLNNKYKPNWQRIYDYLVWGVHDDKEETFFDNINILMP